MGFGLSLSPPAAAKQDIEWPPGFDFASSIESEDYSLDDFYDTYAQDAVTSNQQSLYGLALANLTLGLEKRDTLFLAFAKSIFAQPNDAGAGGLQRELAQAGERYVEALLSQRFVKSDAPEESLVPVTITKKASPAPGFKSITIGLSSIHVTKSTKIKTQVDRVTRDWLQGFHVATAPWALAIEETATWHEGRKIRELVALSGAQALAVTGTRVKRIAGNWYAPDAQGRFRFQIAEDKVFNFPSNFVVDDHTVILNDTHGISALAWDALDANLVVGCGDAVGKMEAAYYLARNGVDVYAPTDRWIGLLIGSDAKGTVIGSAPVKAAADGALIGAQPLTIGADETIVVSTTQGHYPLQYYDTPLRYFSALGDYSRRPLNIVPVDVVKYGHADVVVQKAREIGANVIGIRVWGKEEHDAVAAWLTQDRQHRAVLFHSAVYPQGYRLFFEFPEQTSFGDTLPVFNY